VREARFFLCATLSLAACLLTPVCLAQQTPEAPALGQESQLQVNWFYGAYVPTDVPLLPMTPGTRWKLYDRQSFTTPGIYAKSGFIALLDQARGTPQEWGGGMAGYGRRAAAGYGQFFMQNSLSASGNALLQYEPRYDRCHCSGLWPRTWHAVMRNFVTYNKTEAELRPQFALYGAAFASGMITSTWRPGTEAWKQGGTGVLTQAGFGVLSQWVGEFAPEITRVLNEKRLRKPQD